MTPPGAEKMSEMEDEPETLSLWDEIVQGIENKVKYSRDVNYAISDVKVTDIFYTKRGKVDEDAVTFWSQLIANRGIKDSIETEFGGQLKRGGSSRVQQIPLRKDLTISAEWKEVIKRKIRQIPSLWQIKRRVSLFEPMMKVIEEPVVIDGPETLAEAIMDGETMTPSQSEGQKRKLLRNSSDLTDACESTSQTPSILVSDSVEKLMKRRVTFTDDEKMDVVEALADCTDKTKLKQGLLDLHKFRFICAISQ